MPISRVELVVAHRYNTYKQTQTDIHRHTYTQTYADRLICIHTYKDRVEGPHKQVHPRYPSDRNTPDRISFLGYFFLITIRRLGLR
jgi:hypothetical protein